MKDTGEPCGRRQAHPLHIVQVSLDDAVFNAELGQESRARQEGYARELRNQRPDSVMSLLVVTRCGSTGVLNTNHATFVPVVRGAGIIGRLRGWIALRGALLAAHHEKAIDVITAQDLDDYALVAWRFASPRGIPFVGQLHYDYFSPAARRMKFGGSPKGALARWIARHVLTRCDALRVVGERTARSARPLRRGRSVQTIPVPVSGALIGARPNRSPQGTPRVLFVGRLQAEKNLSAWLEVAAAVARQHGTVEFDIVGEGVERQTLERQAQQLGLAHRVVFHGFVRNDHLGSYYERASVFLLTSHYEGFGRVLVEACAHGVPVVAPRLSGVEDIIRDRQTGYLCEPGHEAEMADCVLHLLGDAEAADRMGQAGCELIRQRFAPERLRTDWVALLVRTAEGRLSDEAGHYS
jgi:glycosyltransferase involved in cell wall biosynthesis